MEGRILRLRTANGQIAGGSHYLRKKGRRRGLAKNFGVTRRPFLT